MSEQMGECDRGVYLASDVESCLGRTRGAEKAHKYCQWVVVMVVVVVGGVQRKEGVRSHLLSAHCTATNVFLLWPSAGKENQRVKKLYRHEWTPHKKIYTH